MGNSRWFFVESKLFEFEVGGVAVLQIYERCRGVLCSFFLGEVSVAWLLTIVEALFQVEGMEEFVKSSRVMNKAFIA
jgi:hypothetical protein